MKKKETDIYLDKLIDQATPKWQNMNPDQWLRNLRGNYSVPEKKLSDKS